MKVQFLSFLERGIPRDIIFRTSCASEQLMQALLGGLQARCLLSCILRMFKVSGCSKLLQQIAAANVRFHDSTKHDLHHEKVEENEHLKYFYICFRMVVRKAMDVAMRLAYPTSAWNPVKSTRCFFKLPMDGPRKVDHIAPSASDQLLFWNPPRRTVALSCLGLVKWNQQSKEPIVCVIVSISNPCLLEDIQLLSMTYFMQKLCSVEQGG